MVNRLLNGERVDGAVAWVHGCRLRVSMTVLVVMVLDYVTELEECEISIIINEMLTDIIFRYSLTVIRSMQILYSYVSALTKQ